jgi:ABC-type dipeptide/oligopeptide/nickel transport system permease component
VNNFIAELFMYFVDVRFLAMLVLLALAMKRGHKTNHIVLMVLVYSLSTPMLWSPLFLLAVFMSGRVARAVVVRPGRARGLPHERSRSVDLDCIIFGLQRVGGISNYWTKLIQFAMSSHRLNTGC